MECKISKYNALHLNIHKCSDLGRFGHIEACMRSFSWSETQSGSQVRCACWEEEKPYATWDYVKYSCVPLRSLPTSQHQSLVQLWKAHFPTDRHWRLSRGEQEVSAEKGREWFKRGDKWRAICGTGSGPSKPSNITCVTILERMCPPCLTGMLLKGLCMRGSTHPQQPSLLRDVTVYDGSKNHIYFPW